MFLAIFDEKFEIRERCKGVHCVDLGESFPTSIVHETNVGKTATGVPSNEYLIAKFGIDTAENEP